jgi:hypothetical protein
MRTAILAALLALGATSVAAQDCRANFGGSYTYAHVGIKPDGHFFSSIASFTFDQNGTFAVSAGINERGEPPFPVGAAGRPWWWIDECDIAVDRAGFVGRVSDDGRFISLATFDDEQMAGIAIRDGR